MFALTLSRTIHGVREARFVPRPQLRGCDTGVVKKAGATVSMCQAGVTLSMAKWRSPPVLDAVSLRATLIHEPTVVPVSLPMVTPGTRHQGLSQLANDRRTPSLFSLISD